ncbi:MAG: tetratricopeptide repeat protein, partial [Paraprevotella sp.]|nr:tetratricopeptide repeat protein [Paraprevotella sp.]
VLGVAAVSVPAMAQYEGTRVYDRIGHGQDSITTLGNIVAYKDSYKAQDYAGAYEPWKAVITKAPCAEVSTYAYGAMILANVLVKEQDAAKKKEYFNELMNLYDTRLKNMDALNSFTKPDKRATKGDILARKAFDYADYGAGVADDYSLDKAYNMFREGIDLINKDGAKEVPGFVLNKFFEISYQKYMADSTNFREQFLKDYMESRDACQNMLSLANEATDSVAAQKILEQYDPTLNHIETLFAQSKAADREQLIAIFGPKIEENKNNLAYLKSALTLLASNDCDDTDVYFKAAEYAYRIQPSYESAIGTAQKYYKEGKVAESIQYYDKALELCSTDQTKAAIALKIANAMAKTGESTKAFTYLDKAVKYSPAIAGKAHLVRAQILAANKNYADAITYCTKAANEDVSISGSANRLKANIQDVQRKNAEYERANAEYKAQKAKQEKEENFWKGGK